MSENNELVFNGASGTPEQGSSPVSEKVLETVQPKESQPEFLTKDQFDEAMQRYSKEIVEQSTRKAQGLVDKSNSRINARVQELVDIVENATGSQLSTEQRRAIRNEVLYREMDTEPVQQVAQPVKQQPQVDPVSLKAQGILESFGVGLDKNSPNYQKIDLQTRDPKAFLASVKEYAAAESQRAQQVETQKPAPEAQLPIGGEGAGSDLMGEYQKRLKTIPRGEAGLMERIRLQSEYRKKGLPV